MAHVTVTVTKINFQTVSSLKRAVETSKIENMRPTTEGNLATAAIFELNEGNGVKSTYYVSETYADLLTAMNAADAEAGAQLTTGKDASNGYVGLTMLKINFKNVVGDIISFFTNTNTVARTYTFQDRNGTIADDTDLALKEAVANKVTSISGASTDTQYGSAKLLYDQLALKAPLASPTFTGNPVVPTQAVGNNSDRAANTAFVEARARQTYYGTATGTNSYEVTLDPILADAGLGFGGIQIRVRFTNASSGASTLAANGTAAVAIVKKNGSTAIGAGDIAANTWYELFNDGTSWVALGI